MYLNKYLGKWNVNVIQFKSTHKSSLLLIIIYDPFPYRDREESSCIKFVRYRYHVNLYYNFAVKIGHVLFIKH